MHGPIPLLIHGESCNMKLVKVLLLLLGIAMVIAPIGAVVFINRNDLSQLVITPQIKNLTSGSNGIFSNNNNNNGNNGNNNNNNGNNNNNNNNNVNGNGSGNNNNNGNNNNGNNNNNNNNANSNSNSGLGGIVTPTFVGAQIDNISRTFSVTVNYTNSLGYDLTLNSFNADVVLTQNNYPLGTVSLPNAVTLPAGQATLVTVSGSWTQDAQNYISTNYPGATSIDVSLVNAVVNVNGITVQTSQSIDVGSVPLT